LEKAQRFCMKNFNGEQLGKKIINSQKHVKHSGTTKRNSEILTVTLIFILCAAILWYCISNTLMDILGTGVLLVFYVIFIADIVDYNRALRNVKREVSEYLEKNREKFK